MTSLSYSNVIKFQYSKKLKIVWPKEDVTFDPCRTTVLQSMKLGVDVNRHKEIIVKAISAILLLLLKHFKLNHIYQVGS